MYPCLLLFISKMRLKQAGVVALDSLIGKIEIGKMRISLFCSFIVGSLFSFEEEFNADQ